MTRGPLFCHPPLPGICVHGGCVVTASFGMPDGSRTRCAAHREEGMVDLVHAMCSRCGVVTASFGMPGSRPSHCAEHGKELGMVDVKHAKRNAKRKARADQARAARQQAPPPPPVQAPLPAAPALTPEFRQLCQRMLPEWARIKLDRLQTLARAQPSRTDPAIQRSAL